MTTVRNHVDWWGGARLRLLDEMVRSSRDIATGSLAEVVMLATARPTRERAALSIELELTGAKLDWADIAALAGRSDLPVII